MISDWCKALKAANRAWAGTGRLGNRSVMTRLRSLLFAQRWLALAIVVAALAMRIVVPAGMMPAFGSGGPTVTICTGNGAVAVPG